MPVSSLKGDGKDNWYHLEQAEHPFVERRFYPQDRIKKRSCQQSNGV